MNRTPAVMNPARAAELLEVSASANDEAVRAAYLRKVQEHPPDRDPDLFEQIRDAYQLMRDPALRARSILEGPDPRAPLTSLLDGVKAKRAFAGTQLWVELLKEKRS